MSRDIKEMYIIMTMRHRYQHGTMAKSRTTAIPIADQGVEQPELSFIAGKNRKWYNHCGRLAISYKMNHTLAV
jgi:hypothetical protein